jgi:hypothetical protein
MRAVVLACVAAILLGAIAGPRAEAQPCSPWQWVNPLPTGQPLLAVTFGDEGYVAVGGFGTIVRSPDGASWATRTSGTKAALYGVAWSGREYVAVGASGEALRSWDSRTWTRQVSGTTETLRAVAWAGREFIAVGDTSTVIGSPDGTQWASLDPPGQYRYAGVASDGAVVVVVGEGQSGGPSGFDSGFAVVTIRNEDGTWTGPTRPPGGGLKAAIWTGTQFVAVGGRGTILTSADGSAWTDRSLWMDQAIVSVAWNGTDLVAVTEFGRVLTSRDGQTWTVRSLGDVPAQIYYLAPLAIVWGANEWAVVGGYWEASAIILTSADAVEWTSRTSGVIGGSSDIVWAGDRFLAAAGTKVVMGSADGRRWTGHDVGVGSGIYKLAWNGRLFVGVGNGEIATSPDGLNWTLRQGPEWNEVLWDVIWANGRFVAVGSQHSGEYGLVLTSFDGINWYRSLVDGIEMIKGVAWSGRRFVAVGQAPLASGGMSLTSNYGLQWSGPTPIYGSSAPSAVACGGGRCVAVGGGTMIVSPDGYGWQLVGPENQALFLDDIAWVGTRFVAVGSPGLIISSSDGRTWVVEDSGTNKSLYGIGASPSVLIATGNGGTILRWQCEPTGYVRRRLQRVSEPLPASPVLIER